jgi:4-hydroxybenzoate polyprenyltransferase
MYAHALPTLWTWILFSNFSRASVPGWFPFVLGGWALAVGIRHLLQHQALEAESDRRAGVRTYAVRYGSAAAQSLIVRVVFPLEALSFVSLLVVIGTRIPVVAAGFVLFLLWHFVKARRAASDTERSFVVRTFILSRFYEKWLPLLILAGISLRDPTWLVLLLVHAGLFRGAPRGERGAARYAAAHGHP